MGERFANGRRQNSMWNETRNCCKSGKKRWWQRWITEYASISPSGDFSITTQTHSPQVTAHYGMSAHFQIACAWLRPYDFAKFPCASVRPPIPQYLRVGLEMCLVSSSDVPNLHQKSNEHERKTWVRGWTNLWTDCSEPLTESYTFSY